MGCTKLYRHLSSGDFGSTLDELSESMKAHISHCEICRRLSDDLLETEKIMECPQLQSVPPGVESRVKRSVMAAIEPRKPWFPSLIFNPQLVGATLVLVFIFAIYTILPVHTPRPVETFVALTDIDSNIIEDSLMDSLNLSEIDETLIYIAVADQFDVTLLDAAWNDIEAVEGQDLYHEDVLTEVSTFQDSDWEALRRYLS